ncbi:MAG: PEP-CTERM sorting domain-containing protein [Candidatus Korobacteraceae bacterium]
MKKICSLSILLLFSLMLAVSTASAIPVYHLTFIGAEGGSLGGIYTYPYGFEINGTGNYPLICDTFTRQINPGDSWDAYVRNMASINASNVGNLFFGSVNGGGNGAVQYYMAAGLLFEDARTNPSNATYDNWAIWYTFEQGAVTSSGGWGSLSAGDQATIQGDSAAAISAAALDTPSQFSNIVIYTPTDGTGQEFFGWNTPAPEPASLALFGSGVLGVAGLLRRKLKAQR